MPTFLAFKEGKVVGTLKGADPAGLTSLVAKNAGPNPPVAPLPVDAEGAKVAGNVRSCFNTFRQIYFASYPLK